MFAFFILVIGYDMILLVKGLNGVQWVCSSVLLSRRTDCGYPHISQNECNKRGCCYDSRNDGYWCFYPSNMVVGSLNYDCISKETASERYSCGYPEILESECNKRGCCFHSSVSNSPCFYNFNGFIENGLTKCNISPKNRVKCGCDIISQSECKYLKCCFDDSIPNAHFCFYPKSMSLGSLSYSCKQMNPTDRVVCGYPAMSEDECIKRNCCFDDSLANALWCFFPNTFRNGFPKYQKKKVR